MQSISYKSIYTILHKLYLQRYLFDIIHNLKYWYLNDTRSKHLSTSTVCLSFARVCVNTNLIMPTIKKDKPSNKL